MSYEPSERLDVTWHARNGAWRLFPADLQLRVSGYPNHLVGRSWADLGTTDPTRSTKGWADRWGKYRKSGLPHGLSLDGTGDYRGKGLWIYGEPGTGKSSLAVTAAQQVSALGWATKFITAANWYDLSTRHMGISDPDEAENYEAAFSAYFTWEGWPLVVLDDLGKEYRSTKGWSANQVDGLIRSRFNSAAPTIVTTNLKLDEIAKRYNDSLASFVHEAFVLIEVRGSDRRRQGGAIPNNASPCAGCLRCHFSLFDGSRSKGGQSRATAAPAQRPAVGEATSGQASNSTVRHRPVNGWRRTSLS